MTGKMYRGILEENLFEWVKKLNLGNQGIFEDGNDPKHRSYVAVY